MLQKDVCRPIREDDSRLDEFTRYRARALGLEIPGPSEVRPASHITTQHDQTIPEENAAFDEMSQAAENRMTFLFPMLATSFPQTRDGNDGLQKYHRR